MTDDVEEPVVIGGRVKFGAAVFVLSILLPLGDLPLVPSLGLSATATATLSGLLLVSAEVLGVNFAHKRIHVEPEKSKSGTGRYVPMTDEARSLLQDLWASRRSSSPHKFVILTRRDRPLNTKALDSRWRKLKRKGVEGVESARLKKTTAHILRHTYASHLAQAGLPLTKLAQYLGHGSAYVSERYTHLSPDDDDGVGAMLSRQFKGPNGSEGVVRDRTETALPGLVSICTVTETVTKDEGSPRKPQGSGPSP